MYPPIQQVHCNMMIPGNDLPCVHYMPLEDNVAGLCDCNTHFICIEALKSKLPKLSHSYVNTWMRCKMEYLYSQIYGISVHDYMLPVPMKCGIIWDTFMNTGEGNQVELYNSLQLEPIDQAKLNALMRAFTDIEIVRVKGIPQLKIKHVIAGHTVVGYIDNGLSDGFEEFKLSERPSYYSRIENIWHQCGTYFMANPEFEYVDMKVAQKPMLRLTQGTQVKPEETLEDFEERCYNDILSRPAYYFIGYDYKTRKWGKRFYKKEFPLEHLEQSYWWIFQEIKDTIERGSWYMNGFSCNTPNECLYKSLCRTGVMSNNIYKYTDKDKVLNRL